MRDAIYFQEELRRRFPAAHSRLCAEIDEQYRAIAPDVAFARLSSNPMDRRLDFCSYFLATILILERHGESPETIRDTCLAVTRAFVQPRNSWQRWLRQLPAKLMGTPVVALMARVMQAKTGRKGHEDGFLVQVVTSPAETHGLGYGFDILECGIVKLFRKHGAGQYVTVLCEVDELTSALAGLELVRGGTLARGASRCDFRFRHLPPKR
ncbi:L-2-amino-thiazoline-4-carboxylic acid hydrolase [Paludibaculum fermentans]|uniref:L-2-amino-thiazoline-4-carboxylic acid hydrolase n=1 Tax=Paludibaculum fermentans TaxID=1473598 RepID=UPI003EC091BF